MPKTSLEVIARAHRIIGVLANDEAPTADMQAYAMDTLEGFLAELTGTQKVAFTWTVETVPDAAFLALSECLAAEVQEHYGIMKVNRSKAIGRLRAALVPDDTQGVPDLDEDGTIQEDETEAYDRAAYY